MKGEVAAEPLRARRPDDVFAVAASAHHQWRVPATCGTKGDVGNGAKGGVCTGANGGVGTREVCEVSATSIMASHRETKPTSQRTRHRGAQ